MEALLTAREVLLGAACETACGRAADGQERRAVRALHGHFRRWTGNGLGLQTTVDRPDRFRRSADVGAHLGLAPRQFQSGEQIDAAGSLRPVR